MAAAIGEAAGIHKAVRIMKQARTKLGAGRPGARAPPKWTAPGVRCVCGPGLARRWFCGFGSGGAFACCASVFVRCGQKLYMYKAYYEYIIL